MDLFAISLYIFFFFFNDTATTEIYTLSLHDALPISYSADEGSFALPAENTDFVNNFGLVFGALCAKQNPAKHEHGSDRKSTRLNSSHSSISYAVFCLKKKKKKS